MFPSRRGKQVLQISGFHSGRVEAQRAIPLISGLLQKVPPRKANNLLSYSRLMTFCLAKATVWAVEALSPSREVLAESIYETLHSRVNYFLIMQP